MIDSGVVSLAEAKEAVIKKNRMKGMKIRDEFICPITYELMREPVVASDGHTYEKSAIEKWLKTSHTSPRNGDPIDGTIIPNYNLKKLIQDIINEGGSGFYTNDISNKDRVFDVSSEKVLVLECLGPPESDWNQQSFQVNRFGCIGGRKHNTEDNFQSKEIVLFKDITVSRRHFEITQQQDAMAKNYYIRDLGSAGGTFVRIAYGTRKQLHPGMIILLGKHQFTVSSIDDSGGDTPRTPKVSARRHSSGTLRKSAFNSMYLMSLVENAEQLIADMSREEAAEPTEEGQKQKEELNARLKNLTITLSNHITQEDEDPDAALQHVAKLAVAAHAEAKVIESKQAFYHHNDGSTANDLLLNTNGAQNGRLKHHPHHSDKKEKKCTTIEESDDMEQSVRNHSVHHSTSIHAPAGPHAAMHSAAMHVTVGPKSTHIMNADGATVTDFPKSSKNNRCCTLTCCAPDGSPLQGKSFTVSTQGAVMGRKFTNGIALYMKVVDADGEERIVNVDTAISSEHARVEYDANTGSFFICDGTAGKASTNGTWFRLSGPHQESPPHVLQASTEVLIGTVRESMTIAEHKVESRSFSAHSDAK